jgi:hypothetical protein
LNSYEIDYNINIGSLMELLCMLLEIAIFLVNDAVNAIIISPSNMLG